MKNYKLLLIVVVVVLAFCFYRKSSFGEEEEEDVSSFGEEEDVSSFGEEEEEEDVSSFGLTCKSDQTSITYNGIETCYSKGNYPDLSQQHPSLGTLEIRTGPNRVSTYASTNFKTLRRVLKPGTTLRYNGWPWSIKIS